MYTFYNEMRDHIVVYSNLSRKTVLTDAEIRSLKPYVNASQDLRDDFDGSIMSQSRGISKPKTKAKTMNSFSSGYNLVEETNVMPIIRAEEKKETPIIKSGESKTFAEYYAEKNAEYSKKQSVEDNIVPFPVKETESKELKNEMPPSPRYYTPTEVDPIDYLVA